MLGEDITGLFDTEATAFFVGQSVKRMREEALEFGGLMDFEISLVSQ